MKAIVIHEKGGPERLVLEDVPDQTPGDSDLLVDVAAAGLNYIDTYHRDGSYQMEFPITPGLEGAGTITAVGSSVDGFAVGDKVGWTYVLGSYASQHVIPANQAIPIPEGIDESEVAAVLLQGLTAHYLATDTFPIAKGVRCLIHAGAGGVGLLLTQIAKMRGAEVVTTVGSDEKAELSRGAGADHVIVYTRDNVRTSIEDQFGENSIDVVYDGVGASTFMDGLGVLRVRGMMVSFGNASGPPPDISPLLLSQKGSLFLTRPSMGHYLQTREELTTRADDLFDWIRAGDLNVRIGAEFSLADAADAHRALEGRKTTGKVLLRP